MGDFGFGFVWVWGIGGVLGSALIGKSIDAIGSRRLLPIIAAALAASFLALVVLDGLVAWFIAILIWGAAGWSSVATLQDVLTRTRQDRTTSIVAFQMAAMYLGASAGSAIGSALLDAGISPGDLPEWAAAAGVAAIALALVVIALRTNNSRDVEVSPQTDPETCDQT